MQWSGLLCCPAFRQIVGGGAQQLRDPLAAGGVQADPVPLPDVRPALGLQIARLQSSNFQSLYRAIVKQMLLDDLIDVLAIDIAIPDSLRIDHHYRALIAAI